MNADSKKHVLSDGKKPPSVPEWILVTLLVGVIAFMTFAFSYVAYILVFAVRTWGK